MRYMLMMNVPYGGGDYQVGRWDAQDFQAHIAFMKTLNAELAESGELAAAEGLAPPGEARIVRADKDGAPRVTDGPFAETKEFLAGFWIVEVASAERAHEIAGRVSMAPGPGGSPLHLAVEVRQVMEAPSPD